MGRKPVGLARRAAHVAFPTLIALLFPLVAFVVNLMWVAPNQPQLPAQTTTQSLREPRMIPPGVTGLSHQRGSRELTGARFQNSLRSRLAACPI